MKLNTGAAIAGALIAAGVVTGLWALLDTRWELLVAAAIVAVPGYIVAAITASAGVGSSWSVSEAVRGALIGCNAAINGAIWFLMVNEGGNQGAAAAVGAIAGGLPLLAAIGPVSRSEAYQGLVGWLNWLLPMSWPIVGAGIVFVLLCLLGHAITGGKVARCKVTGFGVDGGTGTVFLKGGWISNLNPLDTAFNMGNFAFVDAVSTDMHTQHEAGHTLNLAVFGSVFHLIGAADENILRRMGNAYAERLADSNHSPGGNNIPMWA
jgi:hypothetical protein